MSLDDRLVYMILGCAIGFVLGYITRMIREMLSATTKLQGSLRDVKKELDEVADIVKTTNSRGETGFMRRPIVADFVVLIVVGLTAWAAFQSQHAVNQSNASRSRLEAVVHCQNDVLSEALDALNKRSTATINSSVANLELQQAQLKFLGVILHRPPYTEKRQLNAFEKYYNSVGVFVTAASTSVSQAQNNPYPSKGDIAKCVAKEKKDKKDDR